jgi:hypothetical protein
VIRGCTFIGMLIAVAVLPTHADSRLLGPILLRRLWPPAAAVVLARGVGLALGADGPAAVATSVAADA